VLFLFTKIKGILKQSHYEMPDNLALRKN
jgi:hypothetical protein